MNCDLPNSEGELVQEVPSTCPPILTRTPAPVWSAWSTLGFGVAIAGAFVAVQSFVAIAFAVVMGMTGRRLELNELQSNGLMVSLAICATAPVMVGMSACFSWLKRGLPVREYLGLRAVGFRVYVLSLLGLLPVYGLWLGAKQLLHLPDIPQFMLDVYSTAGWLPLLWFAVVVAAPVAEETFFRGFLYQGLARSPLNAIGAILVTSTIWAGIHLQYEFGEIACVFVLGLLLGYIRYKSNSTWPAIAVHAVSNLVSTLELHFLQN